MTIRGIRGLCGIVVIDSDIKTQMKLHIMICDISSRSTLSVKKCDSQRKLYNFQLEIFTSDPFNMNSLDYMYLKC